MGAWENRPHLRRYKPYSLNEYMRNIHNWQATPQKFYLWWQWVTCKQYRPRSRCFFSSLSRSWKGLSWQAVDRSWLWSLQHQKIRNNDESYFEVLAIELTIGLEGRPLIPVTRTLLVDFLTLDRPYPIAQKRRKTAQSHGINYHQKINIPPLRLWNGI